MEINIVQVDKFRFVLESDEISSIINSGFLLLGLRIACFGCGEFMIIFSEERNKEYRLASYLCHRCGNMRIVTTYT